VFAPGIYDADTIARLTQDLRCSINILASPATPSISDLQALGVARISMGSGLMRAGLGQLRRLTQELETSGTYKGLEGAISHAEMNQLMR